MLEQKSLQMTELYHNVGLEKVEEARSINILVAAVSSTVVASLIILLFSFITGFASSMWSLLWTKI